jgi:hypothetical protein
MSDNNGWLSWKDAEILTGHADDLDEMLTEYRAALADGDPWTTSEIAADLIARADRVLHEADHDPEAALDMIEIISIFAATAVQRLVPGDE